MEESEKLIFYGIGGVLGSVLIAVMIVTNFLPKTRVKRAWIISGISMIAGVISILIGVK